ncbi:topology modulation protein [Actinomadura rubteroloni]|uniref:Topology modulation protein n=1 Tax=Actinomadura rubteroloni TaxID=1926885 RepID=A0A2P4UL22_9ACTN|nr:hypothetical protein [Actinomadura rubteroloni]POM25740.1 topology modulation protein [Actinomadura rubteroloni]
MTQTFPSRVAIFGLPGAGKSTLAHELSRRHEIPVHELDDILFARHGALPLDRFRAEVGTVTVGPRWIVDGNYSKLQDVTWDRAELVIWLDYRLPLILWRVTRRNLRRLSGREQTGRRLTWRAAFFGRRSVLGNAARKYIRNRPRYAAQLAQTEARGVTVVRLRSPRKTNRWLRDTQWITDIVH